MVKLTFEAELVILREDLDNQVRTFMKIMEDKAMGPESVAEGLQFVASIREDYVNKTIALYKRHNRPIPHPVQDILQKL